MSARWATVESPAPGSGGFLATEHIHLRQEEKFEVLEGLIRLRCRSEESVCGPGETVVVPAGSPPAWAPDGDKGARVRITFTPGAGIEQFFDEFFRLGLDMYLAQALPGVGGSGVSSAGYMVET